MVSSTQRKIDLTRRLTSHIDVKSHYLGYASTGVSAAGPYQELLVDPTVLIHGAGQFNNYVGSRINPIGLTVRFTLVIGDTTNVMRVGIFQLQNTATPAPPVTNFYSTPSIPQSQIVPYPTDDFNCLYDQMFDLNQSNITTITRKVYIPKKKLLPLTFTTVGAITMGDLYIVALSDSLSAPNPSIVVTSDLKYLDI